MKIRWATAAAVAMMTAGMVAGCGDSSVPAASGPYADAALTTADLPAGWRATDPDSGDDNLFGDKNPFECDKPAPPGFSDSGSDDDGDTTEVAFAGPGDAGIDESVFGAPSATEAKLAYNLVVGYLGSCTSMTVDGTRLTISHPTLAVAADDAFVMRVAGRVHGEEGFVDLAFVRQGAVLAVVAQGGPGTPDSTSTAVLLQTAVNKLGTTKGPSGNAV